MSVFDLIILVILAALTLRGIWKGMVSQIVSVVSFFICWIVATRFGGLIAPTIPVEAPWNQVIAMAIIFLITLIAIRFAHAALEKFIKNWHLAQFNKLLGGLLGFAKGLLLCLIITFFAVMFSETSRAIVFNSQTGNHLVQLITRIGLFVPKDSYEFVHTQFAQFQDKVDGVVPGQAPDTLRIQDSAMVQQMLDQVKQTKAKTETGSLWTALAKWWNGTKDDETEETESEATKTTAVVSQPSSVSTQTAATYIPTPPPQVNLPTAVPQSVAVEEFFVKRAESLSVPQPPPQLTTLPLTAIEISTPSLSTLAPLTELLPMPSESLLPTMPVQYHVGSDLLLHNSGQPAKSSTSAKVFRSL